MSIRIVLILFMLLMASKAAFAGWNGVGEIQVMYIYPTYAVVVQGSSGPGPANCANDGAWSFEWSQFDQLTQNRIQSMLLTAYASKTPIQIVVDSSTCGPENKKRFNGMVQLP